MSSQRQVSATLTEFGACVCSCERRRRVHFQVGRRPTFSNALQMGTTEPVTIEHVV